MSPNIRTPVRLSAAFDICFKIKLQTNPMFCFMLNQKWIRCWPAQQSMYLEFRGVWLSVAWWHEHRASLYRFTIHLQCFTNCKLMTIFHRLSNSINNTLSSAVTVVSSIVMRVYWVQWNPFPKLDSSILVSITVRSSVYSVETDCRIVPLV